MKNIILYLVFHHYHQYLYCVGVSYLANTVNTYKM